MIDPLKKLELDLAFDLEFEQDLARRGIKPLRHIELEKKGWREWLMTLFPFWFQSEFSKEHERFWELRWSVLQRYKRQKEEWGKFSNNDDRVKYFKEQGIYVSNEEATVMALWGRGLGKSAVMEAARIMYASLLGGGYSLIVSETDDQAEEHVGNCRILIEHPDSKLIEYYPDMAIADNADELKGLPTADRKAMFICKNGWILRSKGYTAKMRGLRVGNQRPTELCHEKGTRIFTEGVWMNVEEHPTARIRKERGLSVRLHGLPYPEVVTNEHRYWTRHLPPFARPYWDRVTEGWVEAKDLHSRCYIGMPIDQTVIDPQPIRLNPRRGIAERNAKGQVVRGYAIDDVDGVPDEFHDPDWWWLIGLWWGDGHLYNLRDTRGGLVLTIANTTPHIYDKIKALCDKYGKKLIRGRVGQGCYNVQVAHKPIAQWLQTWKKGNAMKLPPQWVEQMPHEYQKALIRGYLDADGFVDRKGSSIRLTSVYLDGLYCVRRILARLGIPASIRNGVDGRDDYEICGVKCKTRKKYDLRFQKGASILGYDIPDPQRYKYGRVFIENGYLWSKIRSVEVTDDEREFVPIDTPTRDYLTHFGRSHNCFDDIDDVNDSLAVSANKLRVITASILPVLAKDFLIIDFGQNLISEHSVVNQIYSGKSDAFADRTVIGVANAFEVLDLESKIDEVGKLRHKILDSSIPSWLGFNIDQAQRFLNNSGLQTFLAEYQNQFDQYRSGRVIPEYDEISQVITWSQFEKVFGQRRIPKHWRAMVGLDVGYSEGEHPHYSSWAFIATASMNSALPGALFLYRNRTFINTSIDLQAEDVKAAMWDGETVQMWRMSHEKTGEMLTLQQRHQLPFDKFKHFKSSDGIAQWRHLSMRDRTKPNPFKEDEQGADGLWKIGRPSMYYIVDDEQLVTPRDDNGLKLLRDQVSTWELVPVKLTDMGLSQEKPSKVNDDTCLIAGTKILTLSGERNIEDIAVGDMALTRKGYRKVLASGKTGRGAIYTMRSTCGKTVSGTGNHPIILANGDVKKLRYIDVNDTILVCENNQGKARELILRGLRFIATLTPSSIPTETIIRRIRRVGSEVIHPSTSLSGKIITGEKFPKDSTFTTETGIPSTTTFPIWSYYHPPNTLNITEAISVRSDGRIFSSLWRRLVSRPPSGTAAQRDWSFTDISGDLRGRIRNFNLSTAVTAGTPLSPICRGRSSVLPSVGLSSVNGDAPALFRRVLTAVRNQSLFGWIGRFAERLVEKSTIFVNGLLQKIAHSAERLLRRYAPTRWCAVSVANVDIDTHEQDVYNLTVDDAHEYFANGILVHNCDSIKSVLADWAATAVPLTEVEKWELKMRDKGLNKDEILNIETEDEKIAKLQVRLIEERAFAKKKQTGNKSGVKLGWR